MIAECTDCQHCADFAQGFRVFCIHPDLPPNEVCKYAPVNDLHDAWECDYFDNEEWAHSFTWDELGLAEKGSELLTEDHSITYDGIRAWIEIFLAGVA